MTDQTDDEYYSDNERERLPFEKIERDDIIISVHSQYCKRNHVVSFVYHRFLSFYNKYLSFRLSSWQSDRVFSRWRENTEVLKKPLLLLIADFLKNLNLIIVWKEKKFMRKQCHLLFYHILKTFHFVI